MEEPPWLNGEHSPNFQLRHMKDWMDGWGSRELKPISYWSNPSQNTIRPKELKWQLLIASLCQGRLNILLDLDIDHIIHLELSLRALWISLRLHALLGSVVKVQIMGFGDNDHAIRELMSFIEMTSREFIFEDATRNGGSSNYKCWWLQTKRKFKFFYILNLSIGKAVL